MSPIPWLILALVSWAVGLGGIVLVWLLASRGVESRDRSTEEIDELRREQRRDHFYREFEERTLRDLNDEVARG